MTTNTQGIVLHTIRYSETSIIAKIFTRELGLRSYIIKGIRSARGKFKQNMLQPMSHLDLTVYENPKKTLQYVKEMRMASHYNNVSKSSVKMSLFFFIDEVLYKSIREEEPNVALFDYVVRQIQEIDNTADDHANSTVPIRFLIGTARHLGIEPMDNFNTAEPLFNLREGRFLSPPSVYNAQNANNIDYFLDAGSSKMLHHCIAGTHQKEPMPYMSAGQRRTVLTDLLDYYKVHISEFKNFKSHEIFSSLLH